MSNELLVIKESPVKTGLDVQKLSFGKLLRASYNMETAQFYKVHQLKECGD